MSQNKVKDTAPSLRMATILFVDLIGSSDAASFLGTEDYRTHLEDFQKIIDKAWKDLFKLKQQDREDNCYMDEIKGDQGFFLFASALTKEDSERSEYIQNDIFDSLRLALSIKYQWQLNEKNINQIKGNKKPFEIAIGINSGIVSISKESKKKSSSNSCEYKTEGYAINLAKRIEGESRKGTYSKIFVGETTYGLYSNSPGENPVRFKRQKLAPLKGIAGDIRIYEIAAVKPEEDEKEAILTIPEEWKEAPKEISPSLEMVKKFLDATQDTWLGNVYCNVKWYLTQAIEGERDEENYLDIIDMTRKLVEFDSKFSAWKVYLGQMVLSYFKYLLKSDSENDKLDEGGIALLKDTIDILKELTASEPYELDAKLVLGQFYLELTTCDNGIHKRFSTDKGLRELSIDQFRRIIVWDDEHEDAYYYLAAALVAKGSEAQTAEKIETSKEEARKCLDKLLELCKERNESEKRIKDIFKEAAEDKLFYPLKNKIEKII